jgi:hypothetical protein
MTAFWLKPDLHALSHSVGSLASVKAMTRPGPDRLTPLGSTYLSGGPTANEIDDASVMCANLELIFTFLHRYACSRANGFETHVSVSDVVVPDASSSSVQVTLPSGHTVVVHHLRHSFVSTHRYSLVFQWVGWWFANA